MILTVAATLVAGLLPAWQAVRESIARDLHRARKLRVRRALVVGQVAVSLVILAAAFLFLRNLVAARQMGPGFDLTHTLRAEVNLPSDRYTTPERHPQLRRTRACRSCRRLPGISAAAAARIVPFTDSTRFTQRHHVSRHRREGRQRTSAGMPCLADFFRVMGIPVLKGRAFTTADRGSDLVVIVNRTFVNRYLGGRAAVGRTFLWGRDGTEPFRIVGVVEGTKTMTVGEDDVPQLYQPLAQITNDRRRLQFVLRSADATRVAGRGRAKCAASDRAVGRHRRSSRLYSSIGLAFLPSQVGAVLFGAIGLLTLVLAAIGLYGMMAYSVARQTQEIGIRLAIGATRSDISRMVLRDAVTLVAAGSVIGLGIALFVMRPLAMFLVANLTPADPLSLGAVVVVARSRPRWPPPGVRSGVPLASTPRRRCATTDGARRGPEPSRSRMHTVRFVANWTRIARRG